MTITAPSITSAEPYNVVAEVTPEMAEELLKYNTQNRRVVVAAVKEYAQAMKDGRWLFDGAPIRISTDGIVLDGQHRLHAIKASGTTQRLSIWKNINPDAQAVMDTGRKRTFSNTLHIAGEKNPNNVAAITSAYYIWTKGVRNSSLAKVGMTNGSRPQITELNEFFQDNRGRIVDSLGVAFRVAHVLPVSARMMGMLWLVFSEKDEAAATDFFEKLITGSNMEADNPILLLRNRIIIESTRTGKLDPSWQVGLVLKAWNHYREGTKLLRLIYKLTSDAKFPEAK